MPVEVWGVMVFWGRSFFVGGNVAVGYDGGMWRIVVVCLCFWGAVCARGEVPAYGQMYVSGSMGSGREMGAAVGYRYQGGWAGFEYGSMLQWGKDKVYGFFGSLLAFQQGGGQWYCGAGYEDCHERWDEVLSYKKAYKSYKKGTSWGNGVLIVGKKVTQGSFIQLVYRVNGVRGDATHEMPRVALSIGF